MIIDNNLRNTTNIKLTDTLKNEYQTFPMLPAEVKVECGTRFQSYDIMNIGEIKIPLGEELTKFSWSGKLPGILRKNDPYIRVEKDPKAFQEWLSYLRNSNIKCRLLITNTPINHEVYIESYTMKYSGGYGDYDYDISFIHAKPLIISTEEKKPDVKAETKVPTETAKKAQQNRTSTEKGGSYSVQSGDSLWKIAQAKLGDGSKYMEIAKLNNIKDPNKINAGQVLTMPG